MTRKLFATAAVAALAVVGAACGGGGSTSPDVAATCQKDAPQEVALCEKFIKGAEANPQAAKNAINKFNQDINRLNQAEATTTLPADTGDSGQVAPVDQP